MGKVAPTPPGTSSGGLFEKSIAVKSSAFELPAGGPDAQKLNPADFPFRQMPTIRGRREGTYQVVYRQSVLEQIHAHGKTSMEAEVCGMLVGDVYADQSGPWVYVQHCIAGHAAVGKQTQVTITSETWTQMHETLDRDYPGMKIVGWYHTHPGFAIFLSGMDLFIQENFFNQPWHVASVHDPHSGDEGVFVWRMGKASREPFLVEEDAPGAAMSHASSPVAPRDSAASDPSSAPAIENLQRRVKSLERRLDVILTGFLVILLLALVAPLLIVMFRPDVLTTLPAGLHPAPAAATQPAAPTPVEAAVPSHPAPHTPGAANSPAGP